LTTGSFPHDNFSSVYWIFNKLGHMIPLWKGKNPIYFGVKGQGHRYFKYNFWQHDRFCMITLVLYIGSVTNLATWFPCGRGRTLFILGSLPLYRLIIYIDGRILWCTHFLFLLETIVSVVFWKQLKITRIVQVLSWVLRPDCNENCTAST
jgi:hypothetical protein